MYLKMRTLIQVHFHQHLPPMADIYNISSVHNNVGAGITLSKLHPHYRNYVPSIATGGGINGQFSFELQWPLRLCHKVKSQAFWPRQRPDSVQLSKRLYQTREQREARQNSRLGRFA